MAATNVTDAAMTTTTEAATVAPSGGKPGVWLVALMDTWGILSSLVLLILIWTRKELRYTSYLWLVANATFTCLLACVLVTPAIIHQDLAMNTLPEGFCFIYAFLVWVVHFMVPVSLLMVLLDRIVYVYDPIVYIRKMGGCAILAMIFVPWIVAIILATCSFVPFRGAILQRALTQDEDYKHCIVRLGFEFMDSRVKFIVALYYAFPIVLLVAAMLVMMAILCYRRHCCINHLDEFDFECEDTRESVCRAVIPISLVNFVYFVLLLPSLVILFQGLDHGKEFESSAETAMWVFISFEWIQAILWIVLVADIRNAAIRLFCCCCIEDGDDTVNSYQVTKVDKRWR